MTTFWLKAAYVREDYDPKTFELVPGAVPPGIYCADAESFAAFKEGVRANGGRLAPRVDGPSYEGLTIRIATPEQAAKFEASAVEEPASRPARHSAPVGNRG